ncbi:EVE domain-containing protein [Bacillus arachidis]|uniref:EVE domain-containing protein n=1 Tax=Bacillus arachidis TaxID=2819290 RepID=A0ABS3NYZ3_9BACI|nr:EVE domain-containing protein [Bacillus arachidis]MBO1626156.1 EVE domain-containing protein [Bacillus arachidis]
MNHFIFVINDIESSNIKVTAEQIFEILFKKKYWFFHQQTPNLKKIRNSDKVLVYMAGKGRRKFVGKFEIGGDIQVQNLEQNDTYIQAISRLYSLCVPIKNLEIFNNPVCINDIKEELDFITDKKNYGLFFRQATKLIDVDDYSRVIQSALTLL